MIQFSRTLKATTVALGAFLAVGGSTAHAQTPLAPGATVTPVPTITPFFGGTLLSSQVATFNQTNNGRTLSGQLLSAVFSGGTGNALGRDFYYQIFLDNTTTTFLEAISVSDFSGVTTSIGQTTDDIDRDGANFNAGGSPSSSASRSGAGVGVFFNFVNDLGGANNQFPLSVTQFIRTDAVAFTTSGGAAVIGSGVSANSSGPVLSAVAAPEPGSLALLGTGLVSGMGLVARRRRVAKK